MICIGFAFLRSKQGARNGDLATVCALPGHGTWAAWLLTFDRFADA